MVNFTYDLATRYFDVVENSSRGAVAFKVIRWQGDLRFILNARLAKAATLITTSLHQEIIL